MKKKPPVVPKDEQIQHNLQLLADLAKQRLDAVSKNQVRRLGMLTMETLAINNRLHELQGITFVASKHKLYVGS